MPSSEELFVVFRGLIKRARGHLHYICTRTYAEQFPHLDCIKPPDTKCICFEGIRVPGKREYLIITRNGQAFYQESWLQKRPKIKSRARLLDGKGFETWTEWGCLNLVCILNEGLRKILGCEAENLRAREEEYKKTAEEFAEIGNRLFIIRVANEMAGS
jgi:hypothetical protein